MTPLEASITCICGKKDCSVPYGLCHCGCGNETSISPQSDTKRGYRVGQPHIFIVMHQKRIRPIIEHAKPFKIDGVCCRLISLTRGLYAIVDAADYEWLMQWKWHALKCRGVGFYAYRTEFSDGKRIAVPMHRQVLGLSRDDPRFGDHVNRVGIDNRRRNLRPATPSQNQFNSVNKGTTSGRKGVNWSKSKKKWIVRINANRMVIDLGSSESFEEACAIRQAGEKKYHGEFACSA